MQRATTTAAQRTARSGFTLLELLIVISIIAILMAILVPAISSVRYRTRVAQVSAEMQMFEQALATFEKKFGAYPPSGITPTAPATAPASLRLFGTQAEWDLPANATYKSLVRSIWPDFDFASGGRGDTSTHPWGTDPKELTGDECLVFFLGGVPDYSGGAQPVMRGFSKNPRWPLALAGENRDGPFFTEFKSDRLVDEDGDGLPAYLDSLPGQKTPLSYAAASNGRYANNVRCYFQTDNKTPWKKESYQIISPGIDGEFGNILKTATFKAIYSEDTDFGSRIPERDNITNFSGGLLEQ